MKKSEKVFQNLRKRVADNLARIRGSRGYTFAALGDRAGLHWRHLQKIEAGESNVTLITIARLADGLEVDASDLMRRPVREEGERTCRQ